MKYFILLVLVCGCVQKADKTNDIEDGVVRKCECDKECSGGDASFSCMRQLKDVKASWNACIGLYSQYKKEAKAWEDSFIECENRLKRHEETGDGPND